MTIWQNNSYNYKLMLLWTFLCRSRSERASFFRVDYCRLHLTLFRNFSSLKNFHILYRNFNIFMIAFTLKLFAVTFYTML